MLRIAYQKRSVFVTGHTGFKGSWLTLWLQRLGAEVTGYALPPTSPSHWNTLGLDIKEYIEDIRDVAALTKAIQESKPEIIFHLAAQPLVRRSYQCPQETWSTNVLGTVNVLEAARHCPHVQAVVVVTTDKVYENQNWHWGYREADALGGYDPYSASKAACEGVVTSYRRSFEGPMLATARAGNVIGGGDWSEDRLIPDLLRALPGALSIRSPQATRPWQHVLDCLSGYLLLGQRLLDGEGEGAWNFGPHQDDNWTVLHVLEHLQQLWPEVSWYVQEADRNWHEAQALYLDASKAHHVLGWRPRWQLHEALRKTAEWYQGWLQGELLSEAQLDEYLQSKESVCPY